jgi:hypothetical protein
MSLKKLILVLGILFSVFTFSYASVTTLCDTYISDNTGSGNLTTYVSTSTIIPGIHKILSIAVTPVPGTSTASSAAIYDATTSAQITNTNLKGEIESIAENSNDRVFPYPKHLSKGLAIVQSQNTIVTIEYTR